MQHEQHHYVNGAWVDPLQPVLLDVVDPSTEEPATQIAVGGPKDVDRTVVAARAAFPAFARTTAGNVRVNYPPSDTAAAFGGYKQSGNGREYGKWALDEFTEVKAVIGYKAA